MKPARKRNPRCTPADRNELRSERCVRDVGDDGLEQRGRIAFWALAHSGEDLFSFDAVEGTSADQLSVSVQYCRTLLGGRLLCDEVLQFAAFCAWSGTGRALQTAAISSSTRRSSPGTGCTRAPSSA